jgi:membrane-associated phospholipid phosphatase
MDEPTVLELTDAGYGRSPSRIERVLYAPAACDWIVAGYFFTVVVGLSRAHDSPARDQYLLFSLAILTGYVACVYLYRFRVERVGHPVGYGPRLAYHLLPLLAVLVFYLNLRPILPLLNGAVHDDRLYQLDMQIFGFEPTLLIERITTKAVVEWFAFFYYSYFFLIGSFIFVMICTVEDDERLSHFAAGMLFVVCVGHFIYALVPGFGPYEFLAHEYSRPLVGGTFYNLVLDAVSGAGPLRDIFPSLHTALPTFCALFAWRHYPRYAPIVTFFAGNIMAATIVLRWHYAVDVIAGLLLALAAFALAPRVVESYQARRAEVGLASLRRW